jgi:hypothetical protein
MTALLASSAGSDVVARSIAVAGLAVALLSVGLNWLIWHRASPRLKVRLRIESDQDPILGRFVIEVVSVGRIAVVVRSLGVRDHIVVQGSSGSKPTTLLSLPVKPSATLPLSLAPTEYLEAEVGMQAIVDRWDADKKLALVAWAESGDGRRSESRPLRIQTPHRPRTALPDSS